MTYGKRFFAKRKLKAQGSADLVAPIVVDVLSRAGLGTASMLDVGCGDGTWLRAFREAGVENAVGIDAPWSPAHDVIKFDFNRAPVGTFPVLSPARYDFVLSLEFFEHLAAGQAAAAVNWIGQMTDVVVFSAATPGQGGSGHINERWPAYWTELFANEGFKACDFLRPAIWGQSDIAPWYRQNIISYFRPEVPPAILDIAANAWKVASQTPLNLTHPEIYQRSPVWKLMKKVGL